MDKALPKYDSTRLKNVSFNVEEFENELTFSLKLTNSVHESEDADNSENLIAIEGVLEAKNPEGDLATSIIMESLFKSDSVMTEEDLDEIDEDYLLKPIMNEINILLGILTGKAFKVPMILPPFKDEDEVSDE